MPDESHNKFLNEGKSYLKKGDSVEASDKLYKAEEAVKALSWAYANGIGKEVRGRNGRGTSSLLFEDGGQIGEKMGEKLKVTGGYQSRYSC